MIRTQNAASNEVEKDATPFLLGDYILFWHQHFERPELLNGGFFSDHEVMDDDGKVYFVKAPIMHESYHCPEDVIYVFTQDHFGQPTNIRSITNLKFD